VFCDDNELESLAAPPGFSLFTASEPAPALVLTRFLDANRHPLRLKTLYSDDYIIVTS
jgi:hypothetical protein